MKMNKTLLAFATVAAMAAFCTDATATTPADSLPAEQTIVADVAEPEAMETHAPATIVLEAEARMAAAEALQRAADTIVSPDIYSAAASKVALKPYKFLDDVTFSGLPIFAAGIIAKSEKRSFRQDYNAQDPRSRLIKYNFHNTIDNYTQFAPFALAAGLNFAGVRGRSDTWRFLANSAMSYALMALIVNPIKYTAKEMRPDGSTRNSWPSGHTATAFVSATILHKEYGLTRSPWYSVAGYMIATATGVMRVLNNRHWVSDVLSGAGVGIFSTELAYGLCDLLFKGKHLKSNDRPGISDITNKPSFFSISMGLGLGSRNFSFNGQDLDLRDSEGNYSEVKLKFGTATVVGAEGAYFINKYVGFGGRLRVKSMPIKGWNNVSSKSETDIQNMVTYMTNAGLGDWLKSAKLSVESDHITEFTADIGAYFNLPLSSRWALGAKLLGGRSIIQDLNVKGDISGKSIKSFNGITGEVVWGDDYHTRWDYISVSGTNSLKWGTGVSVTYAYKSSFSWRVFADYDYTRKTYTMEYNPNYFYKEAWPSVVESYAAQGYDFVATRRSSIHRAMNSLVLGGAFCISF